MSRHANVAVFVPHLGCPHACSFCNQRTISGAQRAPTAAAVTALLEEARATLGDRAHDAQIAFFGGSFTAMDEALQDRYLQAAQPFLGAGGFGGIRVSTRPDAITDTILDRLRSCGVTAIELGAQSMDDGVLSKNGRGHAAADTRAAAGLIRAGGFELGLQMMTGLPGSTPETDRATARALVGLRPHTVRIYPTQVLRGTALADLYERGEYRPQSLGEAVSLCGELLALFTLEGIPVIRLGLHDEESLRGERLAGPHHPAFRELCEGRVLLQRALTALESQGIPGGSVDLYVEPRSLSKMAGQRRGNLLRLEEAGYRARVLPRTGLSYLGVEAAPRGK